MISNMNSVFTLRDIVIHVLFFLNSFIPLWIILLVQVIFFEPDLNKFQFYIATGIFIGMIIIPTIFVYLFIRNTEKTTGAIKVKIIKNNDHDKNSFVNKWESLFNRKKKIK